MRKILIVVAAILLAPIAAGAQSPPTDLKALFEAARTLGVENELRGDIADRLGFGDEPLPIMDLVIPANGVQHAVNAFIVGDKPYLLFDSHLYVPDVYVFVRSLDGAVVAGIRGRQYQSIADTTAMTAADAAQVVAAEEAFWMKWLADGAKLPVP